MAESTITLRLVAQDLASGKLAQAIGKMDQMARRGGLLGNVMQGVGIQFGMMLNPVALMARGLATVTDVAGDAIDAAANLEESQNKVGAVFDETADQVLAWADDLDSAFGLTEQAALESVGTMGNFVKALGGTEDEARKVGIAMTELAGDLGSFNNVATDEVLVALRSGLAGETEPMRRLGVDIADVRVQALLLAQGVEKVNGQFSQSDKVMARYQLIMEQTSDAQGDAARTVDTLRGQQRRMAAEMGDSLATIGEALIPVATGFTSLAATVIPEAVRQTENFAKAVGGLLDDLDAAVTGQVRMSTTAQLVADAYGLDTEQLISMTNQLRRNEAAAEANKAVQEELGRALPIDTIDLADLSLYDLTEETKAAIEATRGLSAEEQELRKSAETLLKVQTEQRRYFARMAWSIDDATESTERFGLSITGAAIGAASAAGGVDGLSSALRTLDANLDQFSDTKPLAAVNEEIKKTKRAMMEAAEEGRAAAWARNRAHLAELKAEREVTQAAKAALKEWQNQKKGIDDVTAAANRLGETDPKVDIKVNISAALNAIDNVKDAIADLFGTTWTPTISAPASLTNGTGGQPRRGKRKDGAAGATWFPGDWGWVGESGPERIRNVGGVTEVKPAGGRSGMTVVVNAGYIRDARSFVDEIGPELTRWQRRQGVA